MIRLRDPVLFVSLNSHYMSDPEVNVQTADMLLRLRAAICKQVIRQMRALQRRWIFQESSSIFWAWLGINSDLFSPPTHSVADSQTHTLASAARKWPQAQSCKPVLISTCPCLNQTRIKAMLRWTQQESVKKMWKAIQNNQELNQSLDSRKTKRMSVNYFIKLKKLSH